MAVSPKWVLRSYSFIPDSLSFVDDSIRSCLRSSPKETVSFLSPCIFRFIRKGNIRCFVILSACQFISDFCIFSSTSSSADDRWKHFQIRNLHKCLLRGLEWFNCTKICCILAESILRAMTTSEESVTQPSWGTKVSRVRRFKVLFFFQILSLGIRCNR